MITSYVPLKNGHGKCAECGKYKREHGGPHRFCPIIVCRKEQPCLTK